MGPRSSWGLACVAFLFAAAVSAGDSHDLPWTVETVLRTVPPLAHDRSGRWPLITWEPFRNTTNDLSFQKGIPFPVETYRELLRRGLTQAIRMNTNYLAIARVLQEAGAPVIMMEGGGGDGPAALAPDFRHRLPATYKPGFDLKQPRILPCPMVTTGWEVQADRIRALMKTFRDAGIPVDAVWLDWEVEPEFGFERWRQMRACSRCRDQVPLTSRLNPLVYLGFVRRHRQQLLSEYVAKPILEIFPACSVSNWDSMFSSRSRPSHNWWGDINPPMDIGCFTASMPAVYASNVIFTDYWYGRWGAPFRHWRHRRALRKPTGVTDRVYTHVMLSAFSANMANQMAMAPQKECIPWVSGYVIDRDRSDTPVLSRTRYREILRHVWLRGADAVQVFNPWHRQMTATTLLEVQDAASVYDEMLAYTRFMENGEVMNTDTPSFQDTGAIWSGLRLADEAVVRAFTQGKAATPFRLRPWAGAPRLVLDAPPEGATYVLRREGDRIVVEPQLPWTAATPPPMALTQESAGRNLGTGR